MPAYHIICELLHCITPTDHTPFLLSFFKLLFISRLVSSLLFTFLIRILTPYTALSQYLHLLQKSSESPDNFAESAVKRISQAEEPRTAMVFRLLRKGSPDNRKSERYLSIENTAEHSYARSIPLSLQCSRSGKVLPLSEAETSLFVTGVPNSCH